MQAVHHKMRQFLSFQMSHHAYNRAAVLFLRCERSRVATKLCSQVATSFASEVPTCGRAVSSHSQTCSSTCLAYVQSI
uniref:Uncharacterized protein n=1 Tax=Arundo donax TaxID=35708 RepID=A0A0A9CK50_ARUDO